VSGPVRLDLSSPARGPRGKPPRHFADLAPDERGAAFAELGLPSYRATQVATHYYTHLVADTAAMSDVPAAARGAVADAFFPPLLQEVRTLTADRGTTVKTLWRMFDHALVESVLMRYPGRSTLCVSSQVGCGLACAFCATGQMGLTRNLSTGEIVEQVRVAARQLADGELPGGPARLSNVVFMGMGEPLANYQAVLGAVHRIVDPAPEGLGISARNVTVSSAGLVPAIDRLAGEGLPVTFALSLHAPDDELRSELVPINTRWSVDEALDAAHRYFQATGRRVSIEYALIRDVNDHAWRADLLAEKLLARGKHWVHCNPIPMNPVPGSRWTASDPAVEAEFVARLRSHGIPTTVRDTRGSEIDGACGQLAADESEVRAMRAAARRRAVEEETQ